VCAALDRVAADGHVSVALPAAVVVAGKVPRVVVTSMLGEFVAADDVAVEAYKGEDAGADEKLHPATSAGPRTAAPSTVTVGRARRSGNRRLISERRSSTVDQAEGKAPDHSSA
jgi:hypothetical protein